MTETELHYSVLLVEDQPETLERLAAAVSDHTALTLLAAVDNFVEAQQLLSTSPPDVLLTDIDLPDGTGIDLIRLASANQKTSSLVITVFGDEKHIVAALQAGATGYLLKDTGHEDVGTSIIEMVNGGSPISPAIARYLLKYFKPTPTAPDIDDSDVPKLTPREHEVLKLITKGFSYHEIGEMLNISIHTVTSHIKHIYRKLAVSSRGEAVYEARQLGLIDD